MNTKDSAAFDDEEATQLEADDDPDPLSVSAGGAAAGGNSSPGRVHDPYRIRGSALRRSLYFVMVAWIPGAFWMGATSGVAGVELATYLGASKFVFALFTAAGLISVLFQIPGSMLQEWLGARKKFFIWTVTPHRALYILIGLLPWILPAKVRWPAMVMVVIMFVSSAMNNLGGPAWTHWMADLVPSRVRGKYFASRSRMGVAVLCLSGIGVALLLDLCEQKWFNEWMGPVARWARMPPLILLVSVVFMAAGLVGMFDILSFTKVDEPPMRKAAREPVLRWLMRPLLDGDFRRFVAYWSVWTAATSFTNWMWWLYLLRFFADERKAGTHAWWAHHIYLAGTLTLSVGFQLGQMLGYPIWGRAVDRFGRKPVLFISSTVNTTGWIFFLFLSPAMLPWIFVTQIFSGFASGGQEIASFNMMLQFNRRGGGSGYQAVGTVIFSVVGAGSMLLAGKLAEVLRDVTWTMDEGGRYEHTFNFYAVLIVIGMGIKYLGDFVFLPAVRDVGGKSRTHALRFVFDNAYGLLNTAIFEPIWKGTKLAGRGLDGVRETITDAASEGVRKFWK